MDYEYTDAREHVSGFTIKYYPEFDAEFANPRQWDNLGRMVTWHRRYEFGGGANDTHFRNGDVTPHEFFRGLSLKHSALLSNEIPTSSAKAELHVWQH